MNNIFYIVTLPEYGHIIPLMNFFFERYHGVVCILVPKGFREKVMQIMNHAFIQSEFVIKEIEGRYTPPETFTTYSIFTHFHSTAPFLTEVKNFLCDESKKENLHVIVDAVLEYSLDRKFLKKISRVEIVHAILPIFLRTCLRYRVNLTNVFGKTILLPKNIYKLMKLFNTINAGRAEKILLRNFHKNFNLPRFLYINPKIADGIPMPKKTTQLVPHVDRREIIPEPLQDFLKKNKKVVFISFGTVFSKSIAVYEGILKCVPRGVGVVISCKEEQRTMLLEKFSQVAHTYVGTSLPQLAILKQASLMVTHGGYNSINEALHFNVPLLLLPHMYEQELNAKIVQAKGFGKIVETSEKSLSEALVKILDE